MKNHTMKIYIALFLSCASVMAADTGIQVATTTHYAGANNSVAFKTDVFTRDGQTNLVCDTRTKDGALVVRIQSFYHDGVLLGKSMAMPDVQDFVAEAGSPYSVCFRSHSPHDTGFVYVSAKDGSFVDIFTCTNGVYYPADSHLIAEASAGMKTAMTQARDSAK
jgi:hypothetical protein